MNLAGNGRRRSRGMTLVEVVLACVVVAIGVVGGLSYGYHGAVQTQHARTHASAVRVGYYLLEDWKANGGSELYASAASMVPNPTTLEIDGQRFSYDADDGLFKITVEHVAMEIELIRPVGYQQFMDLSARVRWLRGPVTIGSVTLSTTGRVDQAGD